MKIVRILNTFCTPAYFTHVFCILCKNSVSMFNHFCTPFFAYTCILHFVLNKKIQLLSLFNHFFTPSCLHIYLAFRAACLQANFFLNMTLAM